MDVSICHSSLSDAPMIETRGSNTNEGIGGSCVKHGCCSRTQARGREEVLAIFNMCRCSSMGMIASPGWGTEQTDVFCVLNATSHLRRVVRWRERFFLSSVWAISSDE